MTPIEAYEYAASWGSFNRSGDPGACMYGFDTDCKPQSEQHRQNVLDHMRACRLCVVETPDNYDDDELEQLDAFVEFIKKQPIKGDMTTMNREIQFQNGNLCTITYGQVLDAIEDTDSDPFEMKIVDSREWAVIAEAVNVGIDSHLEAITQSEFDNGYCRVAPHDLCILLRRLSEGDIYRDEDDWDVGHSLMDSILMVLGFNDCGHYVGREAMGLE